MASKVLSKLPSDPCIEIDESARVEDFQSGRTKRFLAVGTPPLHSALRTAAEITSNSNATRHGPAVETVPNPFVTREPRLLLPTQSSLRAVTCWPSRHHAGQGRAGRRVDSAEGREYQGPAHGFAANSRCHAWIISSAFSGVNRSMLV